MTKTILKINGMKCGHCEAHANEAIKNAFDIKDVSSSHTNCETVIISESPLDEAKIKDVIAETGYTLVSISSEPYEEKKKGLFSFLKK